uniref:Nodulin n=1 Tax=Astragalus sinicus TaxID=47065 RepID=A7VJH4_ASTSI|nr:nodulin [Astragalus sinicus]
MNYSISHLSLLLGLLGILSTQIFANDVSEALAPSSDIKSKICSAQVSCKGNFGGVNAAANDFILSDVDLNSFTEDTMDATKFEPTRRECSAQLSCGGIIGFASHITFAGSESEMETFIGNSMVKNHAKNIAGPRRLLSDIGTEIEFP